MLGRLLVMQLPWVPHAPVSNPSKLTGSQKKTTVDSVFDLSSVLHLGQTYLFMSHQEKSPNKAWDIYAHSSPEQPFGVCL